MILLGAAPVRDDGFFRAAGSADARAEHLARLVAAGQPAVTALCGRPVVFPVTVNSARHRPACLDCLRLRRTSCPGCTAARAESDLCCEPCWQRLPARIPLVDGGTPRAWRRARGTARSIRDWDGLEALNNAVTLWLMDHPAAG